jgi:glutaredoxin
MEIEIYTVPNCIWCSKTEKLLEMANISEYKKHIVGEGGITSEYIQRKFPTLGGYPIIIVDGKTIPGVIELAKLFIEKGLVSSKKNE